MDKQIYVITDGQYSDYNIEAILLGPPDQSLQDLFEQFHKFTDRKDDSYWHGDLYTDRNNLGKAWQIKLSDEYGLTKDKSTDYEVFASEAALFTEWLIRAHGFERPDWNEINLQQAHNEKKE